MLWIQSFHKSVGLQIHHKISDPNATPQCKGVAGIYVTDNLSVTKRVNVMVGITRSKVIDWIISLNVADNHGLF